MFTPVAAIVADLLDGARAQEERAVGTAVEDHLERLLVGARVVEAVLVVDVVVRQAGAPLRISASRIAVSRWR